MFKILSSCSSSELYFISFLILRPHRCLAADMPSQAKSGHPGAPIACAPMGYCLFTQHMNFNPEDPSWANRDRFILSNGHACALQYSLLHLVGYKVGLEDLKQFRQLGSITPGHPEPFATPGIIFITIFLLFYFFLFFFLFFLNHFSPQVSKSPPVPSVKVSVTPSVWLLPTNTFAPPSTSPTSPFWTTTST